MDKYKDAFVNLEKALQIVNQVGLKPKEIDILEILGDTHVDKYIDDKIEGNLSSAEEFYNKAIKIARSLNMPLQEATSIRGIGIVQAKKGNFAASKESFMMSMETLYRLGAHFELQKTALEYAKVLFKNNFFAEAEIMAKASGFDALRNKYWELLVKVYLLLGDIEMRKEKQYKYYIEALNISEFNSKIYMRTCFMMIFRMKNMQRKILSKLLKSLQELYKDKDKYFNHFLEALHAKIEGREYDIAGLPSSFKQEIEEF